MKAFKPKDIYKPIGMPPRRFTYLVERGVIRPDIQPSPGQGSANLFSSVEALRAGLIYWFESAGFTLDVAWGIADYITSLEIDIYEEEKTIEFFPLEFMVPGAFSDGPCDSIGSYWLVTQGGKVLVLTEDRNLEFFKIRTAESMGLRADTHRKHYFHPGEDFVTLTPIPNVEITVTREIFEGENGYLHICYFDLSEIVWGICTDLSITWHDLKPILWDKAYGPQNRKKGE